MSYRPSKDFGDTRGASQNAYVGNGLQSLCCSQGVLATAFLFNAQGRLLGDPFIATTVRGKLRGALKEAGADELKRKVVEMPRNWVQWSWRQVLSIFGRSTS